MQLNDVDQKRQAIVLAVQLFGGQLADDADDAAYSELCGTLAERTAELTQMPAKSLADLARKGSHLLDLARLGGGDLDLEATELALALARDAVALAAKRRRA
jgi:hypothetical protein